MDTKPKRKGGFAAMSPEQGKAIQRKGALAIHAKGKAGKFTKETAKLAGARSAKRRWDYFWGDVE